MTGDETVGWHHQLSGHEFEQALGDGERRIRKHFQGKKELRREVNECLIANEKNA